MNCGILTTNRCQLPIRAATIEELRRIHSEVYIAEVQLLSVPEEIDASRNEIDSETTQMIMRELAEQYGFGEGDTPAIPGMHDVHRLSQVARSWH